MRILVNGEGRWLTVPIDRDFHGTRVINQIMFSTREDWRKKMLKMLQAAYGRAPCYREALSLLEPLILYRAENLVEFNVNAIIALSKALGLHSCEFIRSSSTPVGSVATQRLIDLIQYVGGTRYLCGGGASGYQKDNEFALRGIELAYQDFVPALYAQSGGKDFVPGLSIIDALMSEGVEGTADLLRECARA